MSKMSIRFYNDHEVRAVWDDENSKWWFSAVDIGKNRDKEIDFVARELGGRQYYIQVSYTIQDGTTRERELSAFRRLDDGYKKILITMDHNPLSNLEYGYQMMHLLDFLLNEKALEEA